MEKLRIIGCAILEKTPGNQFFSLDQIIEITGLDRIHIRRALERFTREKIVLKIAKTPGYMKVINAYPYPETKGRPRLAITYRVKDKKKLEARISPRLKENTALDRAWSVIRNKSKIDGRFTTRDLMTLGNVGRENVRWFMKRLREAGIIRLINKAGPGAEWRLIKDPGPKRPHVGKDKVKVKENNK